MLHMEVIQYVQFVHLSQSEDEKKFWSGEVHLRNGHLRSGTKLIV